MKLKIGVVMPHRNDRDMFLPQFHKCLEHQTLKPDIVEIIDWPAKSEAVDITPRYRDGYERMAGKGVDVVFFMEIDDYYTPDYLEKMAAGWHRHHRPAVFGTNYTIYYHLHIKKYFKFEHFRRSSMMSTMLVPDLEINWPNDDDPYADLHVWKQFKDQALKDKVNNGAWMTFKPDHHLCVGIKHGIGKCGGRMHVDHLYKYNTPDPDMQFLSSIVDPESMEFYRSLEMDHFLDAGGSVK